MDGFWFSSSHHFTLSLSPLPPFIALPNGCLMTMESPWTSWRIDYWLGPEIYTGATATRRAPEEINGICNWVWSLGCVGASASSVSPMAVLTGWWFVRDVGVWCGGFMSHRGWQRRVRLRTLVHFNCSDVRTVWQKMENERKDCRS